MDPVNIVRSADAITDWVTRAAASLRACELTMTEAINNLVKFLELVDCGTREHP